MRLTLENTEKLEAFLKSAPDRATRALGGALMVEAEAIMRKSKQIVPYDLGALRGSGHVAPPEARGTRVSVEMGYGDDAAAYALAQHERLDYRHSPGQQAKYLEQPTLEAHKGFDQRTARRIKRRMEMP